MIINSHTNDIYYKDQFIPLDTPYKVACMHIGSVTSIAAFDFIAFPTVACHNYYASSGVETGPENWEGSHYIGCQVKIFSLINIMDLNMLRTRFQCTMEASYSLQNRWGLCTVHVLWAKWVVPVHAYIHIMCENCV